MALGEFASSQDHVRLKRAWSRGGEQGGGVQNHYYSLSNTTSYVNKGDN